MVRREGAREGRNARLRDVKRKRRGGGGDVPTTMAVKEKPFRTLFITRVFRPARGKGGREGGGSRKEGGRAEGRKSGRRRPTNDGLDHSKRTKRKWKEEGSSLALHCWVPGGPHPSLDGREGREGRRQRRDQSSSKHAPPLSISPPPPLPSLPSPNPRQKEVKRNGPFPVHLVR